MIVFRKVNKLNYSKVLQLSIKENQQGYVESISECLKEADELSLWKPTAIYDDEQLIGFAMYGLWKEEGSHGRVWLDRYLIDYRYQGKGYGRQALKALIDLIFTIYKCEEIYLSVYEDNIAALSLYKSVGFVFNGEKDIHGELVMVLK